MLIVDDEPLILQGLSFALEDDYAVVTAASPTEGLRILTEDPGISVILTDQRMPQMEGCEFLRRAKLVSEALRLLMTGYAKPKTVDQALMDGTIHGYLAKPFRPADLHHMIAEAADAVRR